MTPESAQRPDAVLITGASSGIGQATALHLDRLGFRVFAGVRRDADGSRLRRQASERLTPVLLDVTDPGSIAAARDTVQRLAPDGLAGLVNNAGIVVAAPLEVLPLDRLRQQLEVNVVGVVAVTQAFLPLVRAARGRIVNVSSINGRVTVPVIGAYAASKHALEAVTDACRLELRRWGIHVVAIQPGAIRTPIWETSRAHAREIAREWNPNAAERYAGVARSIEQPGRAPGRAVPPDRVARVVAKALTARRPRTRYAVGWDARIGLWLKRLLPDRLLDRLIAR